MVSDVALRSRAEAVVITISMTQLTIIANNA